MNWELIATLAEVVAAIGVIASLIYVARQVRSSQETAANTNRLTRAGGVTVVDRWVNLTSGYGVFTIFGTAMQVFELPAVTNS